MAQKIIVAYIPVVHAGYRQFLQNNPAHHTLYLLDNDVIHEDRALQKEIRALQPAHARQALIGWNLLDDIYIANHATLAELAKKDVHILMPDDDISHSMAERYFARKKITYYSVFLRWDRRATAKKDPIAADTKISSNELDQQFMRLAHAEGFKSSDIWRRLGALIVQNGEIAAVSHNAGRPHAYRSWMNGDPRATLNQGAGIQMSTFQHAEACAIAEAAKKGTALQGADMYVTTFPCPACAMLIAYSGIKRLFFTEGYAMLDGLDVLKTNDVAVIKVETDLISDASEAYVPYPEN